MSDWGSWSGCDADCGPGHRHRDRAVLSDAVGSGAACGFLDEVRLGLGSAVPRGAVYEYQWRI